MATTKWRLMCIGFNGFGQLNVPTEENEGGNTSSDITVASPRALLELSSPPVSVFVSSCWDSLYVHISTEDGNSHSRCTGVWASCILEAKKLLRQGDDILEVVETPNGLLILRTGEARLLVVASRPSVSLEVRECEDKSIREVTKMSCLKNSGQIYSLLGSGAVYECVFDAQSHHLKLSRELHVDSHQVSDIACGADHCLLLTIAGDIFSFGLGTRGQLGHGDLTSHSEPTLIQALAGVPMKSIACGLWHNLVLSQTGDPYSWGWNQDSQLGLKDPPGNTVTVPALVDVIPEVGGEDVDIVSVSCGSRHSAAVGGSGELFCWGWEGYGQTRQGGVGSGARVHSVYFCHWSTLYLQSDTTISLHAEHQD